MLNSIAHGETLELQLARPPVNAMNPALVQALTDAIADAPQQGYRSIVISGSPGIFSAGLDVPELLTLDCDGMSRFWQAFFRLLGGVAASTIPIVAAITGHSPAGGAVLSLFCDYRIMAQGDYKIGLNEVQVGLMVPPVIQRALIRLLGPHQAERLMVAGAMLEAAEARQVGLVDRLAEPGNVVEQALDWCRQHQALPPMAMAGTRRFARADLVALFDDFSNLGVEQFVNAWFADETQTTLKALVARLKAKAG